MDPVTLAIISFILSFIVAKKNGLSTTASFAAAAGVGGLTYYGAKKWQGRGEGVLDVQESIPPATDGPSFADKLGDAAGNVADWIGKNPGLAAGTAGVVAGATMDKKWLVYGGLGLAAFLILK